MCFSLSVKPFQYGQYYLEYNPGNKGDITRYEQAISQQVRPEQNIDYDENNAESDPSPFVHNRIKFKNLRTKLHKVLRNTKDFDPKSS